MIKRWSSRENVLGSLLAVSDPVVDSALDMHDQRVLLVLRHQLTGEINHALHAVQQHLQLAHHQTTQGGQQREVVAAIAQQVADGQQIAQTLETTQDQETGSSE